LHYFTFCAFHDLCLTADTTAVKDEFSHIVNDYYWYSFKYEFLVCMSCNVIQHNTA